ncbi:MAG TPA: cyclodeaminase/cyclohydrolase family protein [Vicinamibacterales bacterium]|nr:cyclodeaminase/cyclohydrolase family protein [Vicinamibacterales bacterium]
MFVDRSVRELLDAFASSDPTPGGGSASALASAAGAALLQMVASLPKTRSNSDADRAALASVASALTGVRAQLTEAIDSDSRAYDQVVAAYRLPKATDTEKAARKSAIQRGLRAATDVPLVVARLSADALKHADAVAAHGHSGASSDVGVAIELLCAGRRGALLNVEINLGGIEDTAYVAAVRAEAGRLSAT